jgi:hypothetical protein
LNELEKEYTKLERRKFKLECKIEAINDELFHLKLIENDHEGKLNKKRSYRRDHLEKVLLYYYAEIARMQQELDYLRSEINKG